MLYARYSCDSLAISVQFVQSSGMHTASAPERDDAPPPALFFEGVPLMQLAAIAAARAEGFPIEEVLAIEGLEASKYRAADVTFKMRLVDPSERGRLVADYQAELASAEDRLARKVFPLDEDVDSWVRFLGAYSAERAPADWLVGLGLSLPDLARLSRVWSRRFELDDSLRKRAEKAARDKKPYDGSSLQISASRLVSSPAARPVVNSARAPLTSPPVNPIPRWRPRSELLREEPIPSAALDVPVKPVAAPAELVATRLVFSVSSEPSLPFVPAAEMPVEPQVSAEPAIASAPREALSGTSLTLDIPRGPTTPFAVSNTSAKAADKPAVPDKPKVKRAPAELAGTSLAVNVPRGPAMPFAGSKEPALDSEQKVVPKKPQVIRAPAELSGTSLTVDIPRGPATPFAAAEKPAEKSAERKSALSLEQHAALTVEIATYPVHAMAILGRYGITAPQKVELDQHYQRIVSSDPKAQATWHAAYSAHYAKLIRR